MVLPLLHLLRNVVDIVPGRPEGTPLQLQSFRFDFSESERVADHH
jgi:hypothetical protein